MESATPAKTTAKNAQTLPTVLPATLDTISRPPLQTALPVQWPTALVACTLVNVKPAFLVHFLSKLALSTTALLASLAVDPAKTRQAVTDV